jgi:hypothetical protein
MDVPDNISGAPVRALGRGPAIVATAVLRRHYVPAGI